VELLVRRVAAANLAKQQTTAAAQMEKTANPAMWAQGKMQQWKEQEAARTARAAQAVQEYKDTQQAQDELNSLKRAMQAMGLSFEDVSADAVDRQWSPCAKRTSCRHGMQATTTSRSWIREMAELS
jgi:hypothetical protein